ncbi:DegV family protein [Kocuria flava]|uniref:DegV family protein n=1 Tax=Kocuria flava TaxID=446860 RepID=UPI001FF2FAD3|nr:DegV family protein [Kocuria flava]MCJ8503437.1 DegV family protein [Kocuria flava]
MSARRIAVVTDDAAALPPAWAAAAAGTGGLAVVEMPVMIDGQIFPAPERAPGTGDDEVPRALLLALAEGRPVTTSRPSPGQFRRVYQRLEAAGYEGIVSVHLSAELSGTTGSARIGRRAVDVPVTVVDSRTAAMAQGFGVQRAWTAAGAGAGLEEVAAAAREGSRDNTLLLWVPSLEPLRRGGRLAPSAAVLSQVLPIRPLLSIDGGRLVAVEKPRTAARARARFAALVGEALATAEHEDPVLVLHHLGDEDGARELGEQLVEAHRPDARLLVCPLPPVLAAHVGLGARAAVVEGPSARPVLHPVPPGTAPGGD